MIPRKAIRIGAVLLVALALVSTWALVSASDGQVATVTASSSASYSHVGVATVGGTLSCDGLGTLQVSGNLEEPVGKKASIVGGFNSNFSCGPGSPTGWSTQIVPQAGKFGGGSAVLTVYYSGSFQIHSSGYYPPASNCYLSYYDYYTNSYVFQCYVSGTVGPLTVKLAQK
jgi:hypothetical protein